MERMIRGIALEDITAVTKISQRYLVALEQESFRTLPGGILNKGIIRGYATEALVNGMERFMKAYNASGLTVDQDRGWLEFAANVGKARIRHRSRLQATLRWIGALLLVLAGTAGIYLAVRSYGLHAGWWTTLLPMRLL